jgi:hypothetical protein
MTRLTRAACMAAIAAMAAFAGAPGAPAALASPTAITAHQAACPDFTGPAWSIPEFGQSGTAWKVTASHVSCAFATRWAKKLLHTRYKGEAQTKLKGPGGWHCLPSIPHGGGVQGECRSGKKSFGWGPHPPKPPTV